jgi:hypothetical protein
MSEDAEREQAEAVALAHMMGYADAEAAVRAKVVRLEARVRELEAETQRLYDIAVATATGPERDLAEQALEKLEWLARASWGRAKLKTGLPELTVAWGEGILHYHSQIGGRRPSRGITRADALALLRKKGGKDAG